MSENEEIRYAGFKIRFLAYTIDFIIFAPLLILVTLLMARLMFSEPATKIYNEASVVLSIADKDNKEVLMQDEAVKKVEKLNKISSGILTFVTSVYAIVLIANKRQATIGKRVCNICVVKTNGENMSFKTSAIRHLASLLSALSFGIGFIMIAFTKEKTALHDIIADTRVVYGKIE